MTPYLKQALLQGRTHIFAIILALLVGVIYAAPDVYHAHTPGYQGIVMADAPDEDLYLTNINKNYELSGLLGNPYLYEYRDSRNPFQYYFVEFALGKIGAALRMPINVLLQVMQFLFPALLALVLYGFTYKLTGSKLASFLGSAAVLLGNEIVRPSSISNVLNTFLLHGQYGEFLNYSRPISPPVNSLLFFPVLGGLLYLLRNPSSRWVAVSVGAALGSLIYIYIYFWAFAFVVLGVMFLYAIIARNREAALTAGIALASNMLFMAPFLLANLSIFLHGGESAITQAILTHRIIIEKMVLVPLFLYTLIYLWAWRSGGAGRSGVWAYAFAKKYVFVLLLLITGVIVSNQQVLTGRMVFQEHFHFFTNIPLFLLSMSILGTEILHLFPRILRGIFAAMVMVALVWYAGGVQASSYRTHAEESLRYQNLAPIFSYLRTEASPHAVVLTNSYLSTRLTIYTQNFVYSSGGLDPTFRVPRERIVHNYFVTLALRGVTADQVREYMYQKKNRNEMGYTIFIGTYWRDLCGSGGCFSDSVLEELIPAYKEFLSQPLLENIKKYKADYVLWDAKANPEWGLGGLVSEPPVFESGDFKLYSLN